MAATIWRMLKLTGATDEKTPRFRSMGISCSVSCAMILENGWMMYWMPSCERWLTGRGFTSISRSVPFGPRPAVGAVAGGDKLFHLPALCVNDCNLTAGIAGNVGLGAIGPAEDFLSCFGKVECAGHFHRIKVNDRHLIYPDQRHQQPASVRRGRGPIANSRQRHPGLDLVGGGVNHGKLWFSLVGGKDPAVVH